MARCTGLGNHQPVLRYALLIENITAVRPHVMNTGDLSDATVSFMASDFLASQVELLSTWAYVHAFQTMGRVEQCPMPKPWPETGMNALKRACLAIADRVASCLHYAYICRRHYVR